MRFRDARGPVRLRPLVERHLGAGDPTGWFEPVYASAIPRLATVPWATGAPNPALTDWLAGPDAPSGGRAVVVGCGLGDDAAEVARRGFVVTAFDVSPTAIRWARRRFPGLGVQWRVADLLDLEPGMERAFDLVVEVGNVAWLPGVVRDAAMNGVADLVAEGGVAVTIGLVATGPDAATGHPGPPWPQAPSEFATYRAGGLERTSLAHDRGPTTTGDASDADPGPLDADPGQFEVRMTWRRSTPG